MSDQLTNKKSVEEKASENFIKDTADHTMEILNDDGLYRHLSFSDNGSSIYRYYLITWPGYLCFTGDCGTFVFRRLKDMFEFFRGDGINPGYWAEKAESHDRHNGCREYSEEAFKKEVKAWTDNWEFESDEQKEEVLQQVEDEVLSCGDDQTMAFDAAYNFKSEYGHEFDDFFEADLTDYTYRYIWCLRAIVHGIKEYDKVKATLTTDKQD